MRSSRLIGSIAIAIASLSIFDRGPANAVGAGPPANELVVTGNMDNVYAPSPSMLIQLGTVALSASAEAIEKCVRANSIATDIVAQGLTSPRERSGPRAPCLATAFAIYSLVGINVIQEKGCFGTQLASNLATCSPITLLNQRKLEGGLRCGTKLATIILGSFIGL